MDRLPLRWKKLLELICMVAVIHMIAPSSSARAEEVSCRGGGSSFRCFRAEPGATGQVDSWIASINANIPSGQELVGYRHYDSVNLSENWLWCREANGRMTNAVRNFVVAEPMSTTDYRQTYCPTGEVRRWVRAGHVYRVPVSAIPTPGERDHNLATEVATQLRNGVVVTRERAVDVLSQCIANETDTTGMRPDRGETAECVSAGRDLVAQLPAMAAAPAPVVREVVRPSGYITMHDRAPSNQEAMPIWMLALFGAGLLFVGFAFGKFSSQTEIKSLKAKLERSGQLMKEKITEIDDLTKKFLKMPSSEELQVLRIRANLWEKLEDHYDDSYLDQKQREPQGLDVFSFDLMKGMIERWLKPPVENFRKEFEEVWASQGLSEYSPEYLRILLNSGRAFQASRDQSDKLALSSLQGEFGDTVEAIPLLKAEIARLMGELVEKNGAVIEVGRLQESFITSMQRLQTFAVHFGAQPDDFPLSDLSSEDSVMEFYQGVLEFVVRTARLAEEAWQRKYDQIVRENELLEEKDRELAPLLKDRKQRIEELDKVVHGLRQEIGKIKVTLHDEVTKNSQYRGLHFKVAEELGEVMVAHRKQAKVLTRTEAELELSIVQASHAEQFIKDSSREMHEFSGSLDALSVFDPTMNEFFQELRTKFEDLLIKVLNYQLPKTLQSNGTDAHPNGSVRMDVPYDATGTS